MIFILIVSKLWEHSQLSSNDFVSVMGTLELRAVSTTRYFNYDCYELRGYSVDTDLECQYARKQDIQDKIGSQDKVMNNHELSDRACAE